MGLLTLDQVKAAAKLLVGIAQRTPLESSRSLTEAVGVPTYLKCENLQRTGAFKIRGAYNRIHGLSDEQRRAGVVAASAGNHAQGVALASSLLDVKATVFMPEGAALPKVEATAGYGADVVLKGYNYDEAFTAATEFADTSGATMVHPFDHLDVMAGQGTIGLEILEDLPDVTAVIVPVGGGGLISGIASAIKAISPDVKVYGVEPEGAAGMSAALDAGRVVSLDSVKTIADGLASKSAGELTFEHVKTLVDEVVTVSEEEIAQALLLVLERAKMLVEPAGSVGVAALMGGKLSIKDGPIVTLLSGGNIDPMLLMGIIRFGMGSSGRYHFFRTRITDRPGELHRLLGIIAEAGANVVGVEHHREGARLRHFEEVEVAVQVETRGPEGMQKLTDALVGANYPVDDL
jgi:threonine dehydratase